MSDAENKIGDIDADNFQLEVYECPECYFQTGFDATYLKHHNLRAACPNSDCTYYFELESIQ